MTVILKPFLLGGIIVMKTFYGLGKYDCEIHNTKIGPSFNAWVGMFSRCYSVNKRYKQMSYIECTVAPEWHRFSEFKKWFDINYVEDWHVDKDIMVPGNSIYGPHACCYVPRLVNNQFITHKRLDRDLPTGVYIGGRNGKYRVIIGKGIRRIHIGYFSDVGAARNAYLRAKRREVRRVADMYKEELPASVYEAIINYPWEIL